MQCIVHVMKRNVTHLLLEDSGPRPAGLGYLLLGSDHDAVTLNTHVQVLGPDVM